MRITPLEIRNHPFQRRFSGYDREEVDSFLDMVAHDYEGLVRESESLREQVLRLETRVEELSSNEVILQETLITAQKLSDELKSTATREAEVLLGEAEIRGEKILDAAHRRAAKLAEDIREMRSLRTRLAAAVRSTVETHLALLEGLAEDPPENPHLELDSKAAYLSRAPKTPQPDQAG